MKYAVVIEKAESNYSAYVPDLPGCIATGSTIEEVERVLGTNGLGMIPRVRTGGGATHPQDVVTADPLSVYAEAQVFAVANII